MPDGATFTHARTPAPARARKRYLAVELDRPIRDASEKVCQKFMDAIGDDGGHLTWESSPIVMWLAWRIARATR